MLSALSHFIFGNTSSRGIFGGRIRDGSKLPIWKDRSLCFDLKSHELELDQGEQLIGCFYPIEDVKGNPDEQGLLKVTNLRLIWICCKRKQVNLSIGWHTVTMAFEQNLKDPLGQVSTSLCVLSRYESTKYEFIFSKKGCMFDSWNESDSWLSQLDSFVKDKSLHLTHLSPRYLIDPFTTVYKVWQCYKQTQIFRQCKSNLTHLLTRDTLIQHVGQQCGFRLNELNRLASEDIVETYTGVEWIESKTTKHIGTLLLSNIRILWIDENIPLRNLSLPYIRIESIKLRQGADRIILNTCDCVCNTTSIKLRIAPTRLPTMVSSMTFKEGDVLDEQQTRTRALYEKAQSLYAIYKSQPKYGPESCDDCISLMGHLKFVEYFLKTTDTTTVDSSGAETLSSQRLSNPTLDIAEAVRANPRVESKRICDEQLESTEEELANMNHLKLINYLDECPLSYDKDLVYSKGSGLLISQLTKSSGGCLENPDDTPGLHCIQPDWPIWLSCAIVLYSLVGLCLCCTKWIDGKTSTLVIILNLAIGLSYIAQAIYLHEPGAESETLDIAQDTDK